MRIKSLSCFFPALFVTVLLSVGLTACGSDDGDSGDPGAGDGDLATKPTGTTGSSSKQGDEMIPGKKAPDSATDRNGKAPDDVISNRPGGPKPVSP